MNFQGLEFMTWDEFMAWLATDGQRLVLPGLGLVIGILIFAVWKSFKIGIDRVTLAVATTLVLAFSAEGFFEVLNESLALPAAMAGLFAIIGESLGIRFARLAHLHHLKHGVLGPNGRRVWYVAVTFGVIVAFNGQNWVERLLRLALPLLGALLWSSGYLADEPPGERHDGAVTWRWHPRRLAIMLGIIEPGERDLATVHRERLIRALTATAHRLHHGKRLKRLRRRRLRRLALLADDSAVDEVAARIQRVHHIEHLTAPATLDEYHSRLEARPAAGTPTAPVPLEPAAQRDSASDTDPATPRDHSPDSSPNGIPHGASWPEQAGFNPELFSEQSTLDVVPDRQGSRLGGDQHGRSEGEVDIGELDEIMASLNETAENEQPGELAEKPSVAAMRRFWDQEVAKGHVPTGASLSKAAGVDPSTGLGRRKRREWEQELPGHLRPTAPAGK